jgi:hypothetical protein
MSEKDGIARLGAFSRVFFEVERSSEPKCSTTANSWPKQATSQRYNHGNVRMSKQVAPTHEFALPNNPALLHTLSDICLIEFKRLKLGVMQQRA